MIKQTLNMVDEVTLVEQAMAKFPKAKRIAVENATMGQEDNMAFRMNLEADRASYGWNGQTMSAINFVMRGKKS
jgi:hypothetical protein